jgi:hypothetical protein
LSGYLVRPTRRVPPSIVAGDENAHAPPQHVTRTRAVQRASAEQASGWTPTKVVSTLRRPARCSAFGNAFHLLGRLSVAQQRQARQDEKSGSYGVESGCDAPKLLGFRHGCDPARGMTGSSSVSHMFTAAENAKARRPAPILSARVCLRGQADCVRIVVRMGCARHTDIRLCGHNLNGDCGIAVTARA